MNENEMQTESNTASILQVFAPSDPNVEIKMKNTNEKKNC